MRLRLAVLIILALPAAPAAAAQVDNAGVFFSDAGFSYAGGDGNNVATIVFMNSGGGNHFVTETGAGVTIDPPDPPCGWLTSPERGFCPSAPGNLVEVLLAGGNDQLLADTLTSPVIAIAGSGNDTLNLGNGADRATGFSGDDTLRGGGGADQLSDQGFPGFFLPGGGDPGGGTDVLDGQGGDDLLDGGRLPSDPGGGNSGSGADDLIGGQGVDTVDYTQRTAGVFVTVDGGPGAGDDDGGTGEHDDVEGVERLLLSQAGDVATGGATADRLEGRGGGDFLTGGGGADALYGGRPDDPLASGNDTLDGGAGADLIAGGDGIDTVSYVSRTAPVTVTLDGEANDGEAGEGDRVMPDVELVFTGSAPDSLTGGPSADALDGGEGADQIAGAGGDDTLIGATGGDTVTGGSGEDTIDAGAGDDLVEARDNGARDTVVCGEGTDTVHADAADSVAADCEVVERPSGPPGSDPGTTTPPPPGTTSALIAAPTTGKATLRRSRVALVVGCPAAATVPCAGLLTLRTAGKRKRTLARAGFSVAPGRTKTLRLELRRQQAAALRRTRRATARFDTAAGRTKVALRLAR